jgi:hypothetical protein
MGYWLGSGVDSYEIETTLYCPTCETDTEDIICIVEGSQGVGVCPTCNEEITFDVD